MSTIIRLKLLKQNNNLSVCGKCLFILLMCTTIGCVIQTQLPVSYDVYHGTSDASAGIALRNDMFVVADDECNVLKVYKTDSSTQPIASCDLSAFIVDDPEHPEADIEGATIIGDRIYWISSHGRNQDGKIRKNRYRFFATSVAVNGNSVILTPLGVPCRTLIHEMTKSQTTRKLGLDKATRFDAKKLKKKDRKKLAPKKEGVNIEGLSATADGKTLYIGFRNPRFVDQATSKEKAIIVPLHNAREVIEKGKVPIFGVLPQLLFYHCRPGRWKTRSCLISLVRQKRTSTCAGKQISGGSRQFYS